MLKARFLVDTNTLLRFVQSDSPEYPFIQIAAMRVHHIDKLLTLNVKDFVRYGGIIVLSPRDVLAVE